MRTNKDQSFHLPLIICVFIINYISVYLKRVRAYYYGIQNNVKLTFRISSKYLEVALVFL